MDVTERKEAEKALELNRAELEAIYENAPVLMCALTSERRILYANRLFNEFTGLPESQLVGGVACGAFGCINALEDPRGCGFGSTCSECKLRMAIEDTLQTGFAHKAIEYRTLMERKGVRAEVHMVGSTALISTENQPRILLCLQDVTEQKKMESSLRESEERFRLTFDQSPIGAAIVSMDYRFLRVNEALCRITGYSMVELTSVGFPDITHPDDLAGDMELARQLERRQIEFYEMDKRYVRKNGTLVWIHLSVRMMNNLEGQPIYFLPTMQDITEHRHAEMLLRQSEERYRSVVAAMTEGIVVHDAHGAIVEANASALHILGLSMEQIQGRYSTDPMWRTVHEDGAPFPGDMHPATISLRTGKPVVNTVMGIHRTDGSLMWITVNSLPLLRPGELSPRGVVVTFSDITERKKAADELNESREQLRALVARSAAAEDSERKRIARELHDQLGQSLVALGLNLEFIGNSMPMPSDHPVRARISDSLAILGQTRDCLRQMLAELRPPILDDYGLEAALRWYGGQFAARSGIAVDVASELGKTRLNSAAENCLFRIAQEALNNVAKHASASNVWIWLVVSSGRVCLEITDDGRGFMISNIPEPGRDCWGVLTMKERVMGLHGSFRIESSPGLGASVLVELPL